MQKSNILYPIFKWIRSLINTALIVSVCYLGPSNWFSILFKVSYLFGILILLLYFIPTRLRSQVWERTTKEYRTKAVISTKASVIVILIGFLILFFWSNWSPLWILIVGIHDFMTVYILNEINNSIKKD